MKKRHINIPVFIPHLGCPNQCVFCDQRTISGHTSFDESGVLREIEDAISTSEGCEREIAFFGGSFTGIDRSLMIRLLDMAQRYVDSGEVSAIRMSTRPDYIDGEIIGILKKYTLSEVELGVQSMSPHVLEASKRGHTAEASERACRLLQSAGIPCVGQMMIGLPGSEPADEVYTAEKLCSMGVSAVRIYPTVVFRGTELADMIGGGYRPLDTEEAVARSADVLEIFIAHGIPCRRIGLCDSEMLHSSEKYAAGPAHPAMGELVRSEIYRRRISAQMTCADGRRVTIEVPLGRISAAVGQRGGNREYFTRQYGAEGIKFVENSALPEYNVRVSFD